MIPKNRIPDHPGEILKMYLDELQVTQTKLAKHLDIPLQRINEIASGKRGITPETALLFGEALGTTAEFWTNLQTTYDLARAKHKSGRRVRRLTEAAAIERTPTHP